MSTRRSLLILIMVCLAVGIVSGLALLDARRQLSQGAADLNQAQEAASAPHISQMSDQVDLIWGDVVRADDHFQQANREVSVLSPILRHLGWVPGIGADLSSAPAATNIAISTTQGLRALLTGIQPLAADLSNRRHSHQEIPGLVRLIAAGRLNYRAACTSFQAASQARLALGANPPRDIQSRLASFDRRLPDLLAICQGLQRLPHLLGFPRQITYLVAYQNEDELRATGGFIGSAGLVTVHDGNLNTQFHGTSIAHENLSVPPPEPVLLYNQEAAWLLRDSNWSPNFPTSAQLELFFLKLDLHRGADAVLDLTAGAAQDILRATGPIYLPAYQRWVNASNVASLADYYAHYTPVHGPYQFSSAGTTRQQFIAIVTQAVLRRLPSYSGQTLLKLAQDVGQAISDRDLLLYFRNKQDESILRATNAAGIIDPTRGDYLYVVDTNLSYNKVNPYVHVSTNYQTSIRADGWLHSRLDIHLAYTKPPTALLGQGIGPGGGLYGRPYDYADFIRVLAPAGAQIIAQDGWSQAWSSGPAYGKTMFSGYIIVPAGQQRTVHVEYVIPPNVFTASSGRSYHLTVQFQPGSHPQRWQGSLSKGSAILRHWHIDTPHRDWSLSEPIPPVAVHPIPLPRQTSPVVAGGHWIEPHAYLSVPGR